MFDASNICEVQNTPTLKFSPQFAFRTRPRGHKTFFMLNIDEHVILNAHKYKKYQENRHFLDSDKHRMLFFLLINVKMPTTVGILTFMSRKKFLIVCMKVQGAVIITLMRVS